ncbi:hypothetical protein D3C80_1350100 [compost metagenome]
MHQPGIAAVPHGGLVFNGAVADTDNQVCQMQQPVAGLIIEESDAPGKAGKVFLVHGSGGLIGAGHRDTAFFQQLTQRYAVRGLAGHQPQQAHRVFGVFD